MARLRSVVTLATVVTLSGLPAFVLACASLCGPMSDGRLQAETADAIVQPDAPTHAHQHAADATHEHRPSGQPSVPASRLRASAGDHDCCPSVPYAVSEVAVKVRAETARPASESPVEVGSTLEGSLPRRSIEAHALPASAASSVSHLPLVLRV